jgi:hypothetical protein
MSRDNKDSDKKQQASLGQEISASELSKLSRKNQGLEGAELSSRHLKMTQNEDGDRPSLKPIILIALFIGFLYLMQLFSMVTRARNHWRAHIQPCIDYFSDVFSYIGSFF